jgi:hypothetical protein
MSSEWATMNPANIEKIGVHFFRQTGQAEIIDIILARSWHIAFKYNDCHCQQTLFMGTK